MWSPAIYDLLGVGHDQQATNELFFTRVHDGDRTRVRERFNHALTTRSLYNEEFRIVRSDGSIRHVAGLGRVVSEAAGKPLRVIGVNYDITERKRQEEQIRLLLGEVNHRAKNMLTLVQAVARQTAAASIDDFLKRFGKRLHAMAASQDLLVKAEWKGVCLGELISLQLAHFEDLIGTRIEIRGPPIHILASAAQNIGMALHELATNAGKYGALSGAEAASRSSGASGGPPQAEKFLP